jgi:hypothetical protein
VRHYGYGALVGLLAGLAIAGVIASTSGEIDALAPIPISGSLQLPALMLIGLLAGFAARDFGRSIVALGVSIVVGTLLFGCMLAVPGFDPDNYTVSRLNNAFSQGLYALLVSSTFVLVGIAAALAVNVWARQLDA